VLVYGDGLRACAPIFRFSNVVIVVLKLASEFGKCVEETLVRGWCTENIMVCNSVL
jgi:hypothetical protein